MGKALIYSGLVLILVGLLISALGRTSLPFGRLPGDIVWRGKNTTFYFPIVTCLVLSLLGSLLLWLISRR